MQGIRFGYLLFVVLGLLMNLAHADLAPQDPGTHFFEETFGDLQDEARTVTEEGKQALLIMFETKDCPYCAKMKATILNQPDVQAYYRQHFRIISMDIEGDLPIVDFNGHNTTEKQFSFNEHRVRATPVFGFFDSKGQMIRRYTGVTRDKQEFLLLGRFVAEGHYKDGNFTRWKRGQSATVN